MSSATRATRRSSRAPPSSFTFQLALADIPDGPLANILAHLDDVNDIRRLSIVSKSWHVGGERVDLWLALAMQRGVNMPARSKRGLRSSVDLRRTFFAHHASQQALRTQALDARAWALINTMRTRDAAEQLKRELLKDPALPAGHCLDPSKYLGHSTLLHAAARFGRLRCARVLLELGAEQRWTSLAPGAMLQDNVLTTLTDGGNFTPLTMAAWCGHLAVVNELLRHGAQDDVLGTPPMTSACGGVGPFNGETWARRKGFEDVARSIRAKRVLREFVRAAMVAERSPESVSATVDLMTELGGLMEHV